MKYKMIASPNGETFSIEDENGTTFAVVRGENMAQQIAHLPEILEALDAMVNFGRKYPFRAGNALQKKLKKFRT